VEWSAYKAFASVLIAPSGNPTTTHVRTPLAAAWRACAELTHTLWKPWSRACAHSAAMSAVVAAGASSVCSIVAATSGGTAVAAVASTDARIAAVRESSARQYVSLCLLSSILLSASGLFFFWPTVQSSQQLCTYLGR